MTTIHTTTTATNYNNNHSSNRRNHGDDDDDGNKEEMTVSSDEALCEMLGLPSLDLPLVMMDDDDDDNNNVDGDHDDDDDDDKNAGGSVLYWSQSQLVDLLSSKYAHLLPEYQRGSVCFFPTELWIPAAHMRRLTDELVRSTNKREKADKTTSAHVMSALTKWNEFVVDLSYMLKKVWGGDRVRVDRTYETIPGSPPQQLPKRALTRLENFVSHHHEWRQLTDYIGQCLSALLQTEYVLYKEKLNLKPPGGSGFAPHLDTPSLRMAWNTLPSSSTTKEEEGIGPQTFVTVMVAIDDMRIENGCLRIAKGAWSEGHHCPLILPDVHGNPDAAGRAGAIPLDVADALSYDPLPCRGGAMAVFDGWAPHRSAPNTSPFARRAVIFTYNPKAEGDFHDDYYQRMTQLRTNWQREQQQQQQQLSVLDPIERDAVATIPRI